MQILRLRIRKEGTSEDICKVQKKKQNLTNVYQIKLMNFSGERSWEIMKVYFLSNYIKIR
jgi:hypothetical protein